MACKVNNGKFNSHCAELLVCPSYYQKQFREEVNICFKTH